jgi:hypothetical protein
MLVLVASAWAGQGVPAPESDEGTLTAGEFRNNAYTTEKGTVCLHAFLRSQFGITDDLDIKVPLLGWIEGPRGSVELALVQEPGFAFSLEPEFAFGWGLKNRLAGGNARMTIGAGPDRIDLSVGGFYHRSYLADVDPDTEGDQTEIDVNARIPVNLGFDLVTSPRTTFRLVVNTDALAIAHGALNDDSNTFSSLSTAGVNWNHAYGDEFRLSLGVAVVAAGALGGAARDLPNGTQLPPIGVLPLPTFELWWKL